MSELSFLPICFPLSLRFITICPLVLGLFSLSWDPDPDHNTDLVNSIAQVLPRKNPLIFQHLMGQFYLRVALGNGEFCQNPFTGKQPSLMMSLLVSLLESAQTHRLIHPLLLNLFLACFWCITHFFFFFLECSYV